MENDEIFFLNVLSRLKLALDCADDLGVAERLEMSRTAFANRKSRGSLPREHIDRAIQKEGLNPEFIYHGTGPVHLDVDVESWQAGWRKRVKQLLSVGTYNGVLVSQGHAAKVLAAVVAGKEEPTPRLLRDMQKHLGIDLNWLVVGDTSTQHTKDEDALLTHYRKATKEGQAFITQAAGMAKTQRDELAQQHRELTDPKTGKFLPGAQTAPSADGIRVRVPIRPKPKRNKA